MRPLRLLATLIIFSGIAFAFGQFLRTGSSETGPSPLLHDHPNLVLTEDFGDRVLITWKAAASTRSGMMLFDTVSRGGDTSKYAFSASALKSNGLSISPLETTVRPGKKRGNTRKFIVELEGLNELTTYYFVLKNNNEISREYQFITPTGNIAANHAY
jgi:hypothetical protein